MGIGYQCSKCRSRLNAKWGEETVRCPKCRTRSRVPKVATGWEDIKTRVRCGWVTGQIVKVESLAIPLVSGSGHVTTAYRPISPTRGYPETTGQMEIDTNVFKECRFWVREGSGRESLVESHVRNLAVREGQTVSVIYLAGKDTGEKAWVSVANHTSGELLSVQKPSKALQTLGIASYWEENDPQATERQKSHSYGYSIAHRRNHFLLGITGGSIGIVLFLVGLKTAVPLLTLLGIGIALAGIGLLVQLVDSLLSASRSLEVGPPIVRCSVHAEISEWVQEYTETTLNPIPPPPKYEVL